MMNCPPEIAEIILELLQTALLRIRSQGWAGNSRRCAVEADHVHNLPDLLTNFSSEKLHYYWTVERPALLRDIGADDLQFHDLWNRLSVYVDVTATSSTR
jgi:hypothetical protein